MPPDFFALSREAVFTEFAKGGSPLTDRHGRRIPFIATWTVVQSIGCGPRP